MSEEVSVPKPKQYLLMVDENAMTLLSKVIPGIQYCLVEGLTMTDNPNYQLLANPMPKPLE